VSEKELKDKIIIGELRNVDKPEFTTEWCKLIDTQFAE